MGTIQKRWTASDWRARGNIGRSASKVEAAKGAEQFAKACSREHVIEAGMQSNNEFNRSREWAIWLWARTRRLRIRCGVVVETGACGCALVSGSLLPRGMDVSCDVDWTTLDVSRGVS